MQRAVRAAALDCRCLTLDVTPEQLEHAINGMRAMGFCGAILASPHQTTARGYLDEARGVAADHDYVDLVYLEDGRLVGEASIGDAILALIKRTVDPKSSPARVEQAGDGPPPIAASALVVGRDARAVAIAKSFAAVGIATTVAGVGAADADEGMSAESETEATSFAASEDVSVEAETAHVEGERSETKHGVQETALGTVTATSAKSSDEEIRYLPMEQLQDHLPSLAAELVVYVESAELPSALPEAAKVVVDLTTEPVHTEFLRMAEAAGCKTINSVNVQLEMLVLAFQRWTGVEPDVQIMREALEEFLLV